VTGMLTIDRVDDKQEMLDTKKAFDTLMFTQEQQLDLFKITSAVANWGNTQWKQRPREEQAEPDGTEWLEIVARLLGLDEQELIKGLSIYISINIQLTNPNSLNTQSTPTISIPNDNNILSPLTT